MDEGSNISSLGLQVKLHEEQRGQWQMQTHSKKYSNCGTVEFHLVATLGFHFNINSNCGIDKSFCIYIYSQLCAYTFNFKG